GRARLMTDRAQFIRDLEKKVETFVRTEVIPFEKDPRNAGHGPDASLIRELKDKAARAGLIAPQLPKAWGGHDLTHREMAIIFKAAGYSPLGPAAINVMAPDEGNMHLIAKVATPAQAERFLKPLAAGKIRSAFLMTEPHPGAGSDPSMIKTEAKRDGDS